MTENEKKVLELGAKYCPVEHDIDRSRLQKDLNAGFRKMKLKDFFYPVNEDNRDEEEKRFYLKNSDWEPPPNQVNRCLSAHNQVLQSKFDKWKQPVRVSSNLSAGMQKALRDLKKDNEHDIKMDDKGGSFVYADKDDYCAAATLD